MNFRTGAQPNVAVNPVTGHLYLAYHDNPPGVDRGNIYFRQSVNGGNTWSSPIQLNDDATTADQWHPSITTTPDGMNVFVGFYDRRLATSQNGLIDRFAAVGRINGVSISSTITWLPNQRVTDASFPESGELNPDPNFAYMDDYDQSTSDNLSFYTTWGDNRLASQLHAGTQQDVRCAKVPAAVVVDGTSTNDVIMIRRKSSDPSILEVVVNGVVTERVYNLVPKVVVNGMDGNDSVTVASDVLIGVKLYGGPGLDTLNGSLHADWIFGDDGNDSMLASAGDDRVFGGVGNDYIHGGDGYDLVFGDAGDDIVSGGKDSDTAYGGDGNDLIYEVDSSVDYINGGTGIDTAYTDPLDGRGEVEIVEDVEVIIVP